MKWSGNSKNRLVETLTNEPAFVVNNLHGHIKEPLKEERMALMSKLAEGRKSGEEEGWISSEDAREHFRIRANAK